MWFFNLCELSLFKDKKLIAREAYIKTGHTFSPKNGLSRAPLLIRMSDCANWLWVYEYSSMRGMEVIVGPAAQIACLTIPSQCPWEPLPQGERNHLVDPSIQSGSLNLSGEIERQRDLTLSALSDDLAEGTALSLFTSISLKMKADVTGEHSCHENLNGQKRPLLVYHVNFLRYTYRKMASIEFWYRSHGK